jgi:two-component system CheB/CheR fusion protein
MQKDTTITAEHFEPTLAELRDVANRVLLRQLDEARALAERLQAERDQLIEALLAMEEERDGYWELYARSPAPTLLLDARGAVTEMNAAASRLLEIAPQHLIGTTLFRLFEPEQRHAFAALLIECPAAPTPAKWKARVSTVSHAALSLQFVIRRRERDSGGFVATLEDLSGTEAAEAERARLSAAEHQASAANQAKDQFIAVLSHELRTPLTPVLAAVSSFAEREDLPSDIRATFSMVQRNVAIEAHLIDDLLDVTRIAHGKLQVQLSPLDAHAVVRDAVGMLRTELNAKQLEMSLELGAKASWVRADSVRLRQVFWNLLRNAIKFSPEGARIALRSWNDDGALLVEVNDNGRGIDPAVLARLFRPFEQSEEAVQEGNLRGLGLGLAICRGILDLHDAQISGTSAGLGKGARFTVRFDTTVTPVEAQPPSRRASSAPPAPGLARILLVEDHEDTAEILQLLLKRNGYDVAVATSVESALAVDRASYDVLVSDIGLADGSGHDLMRQLRKTGKLKGVALSGYGTEADVQASVEAGFAVHVTKPVNFSDLLQAIEHLER